MEFSLEELMGLEAPAKNAPALHRRLGRADHHEPGRGGADPALEGKARRGRTRRPRRATWSSNSASSPRRSTEAGMSATLGAPSPTVSAGSSIQ